MTPKPHRPNIKDYRPKLSEDTRDTLFALAEDQGFFVEQPGRYVGDPSIPALLDSLAAAYRRDPAAVKDAMRELGVFWRSSPDDAE